MSMVIAPFLFMNAVFSVLDLRLPFTAAEIEVLKNFVVAPPKLHRVSWAYVKVYQYWWEYLKGKTYMTLFFLLF